MSVAKKDCVFYAKVVKGYIPKVSFDAIATNISRIPISVSVNGMVIRVADREEAKLAHSMWDIEWERKQFTFFKCSESMTFTLNAKHLQKMLKNVKKKDLLIFFISAKKRSMMGISIQPTGSQGDHAAKMETTYISINHVEIILPMLPDKGGYSHPMVVGSNDFQKIKKMSGVSKTTINVVMQKSNYIAFKSGDKKVLTNELQYGELLMNPDDDGCDHSDDEISTKEEDSDSEDNESNSDDSEDYLSKYPSIYDQDFDMNLFAPLIKLPGLCTQMEFYVPLINNFPLKISMTASSGLGRISYYIKDKRQIGAIEPQKK